MGGAEGGSEGERTLVSTGSPAYEGSSQSCRHQLPEGSSLSYQSERLGRNCIIQSVPGDAEASALEV
jgi:hypothetical protein